MTVDTASADRSAVCQEQLERAEDLLAKSDRVRARQMLEAIVSIEAMAADDVDEIRAKEQAVYHLTSLYAAAKDGDGLIALLRNIRGFFALLPKAKATRMVRKIFESIVLCGVPLEEQRSVCVDTIQWARKEKRTFLRHRLQLRLVEVSFEQHDARTALQALIALLREVRRLDDRTLLLDIHLLESKIYYSIRNTAKARAALVSARTTANSIYCPPLAQAEIDLQSGVLHADERDYKTAYSYLFEAFEGFHQLGNQAQLARKALHYMVIAKVFSDNTDELMALLASKSVLEYSGEDIEALRGIADAYVRQDTHVFNEVLSRNAAVAGVGSPSSSLSPATAPSAKKGGGAGANDADDADGVIEGSAASLLRDEVIGRQLREMYDTLVERHLLKVVRPYNRVQISFLASLLKLDEETVEARISQLILDKKLSGIVDQQHACLIAFDAVETDGNGASVEGEDGFHENAVDQAAAEARGKITLYQDSLIALERYDSLVTALLDKVGGKFDSLVEDRLAKHQQTLRKNKAGKDKDAPGADEAKKQTEGKKEEPDAKDKKRK